MPTFDLTKLLNPKTWAYIVLLAILAWVGYKGYNWIYERGYDQKAGEVKEQIDTLTSERDTAVNRYNTYKGTYDNWVANTKQAQERLLAEQAEGLKQREERLRLAELAAKNKPVTVKEVIKYVPAKVDAIYRLPVGFVRLYRESIEGGPAASDSLAGLPQSQWLDVGEASGLTVSQFGQIAAQNNAECVVRGKVIEEWQGWYETNAADFAKFRQWQEANAPKPVE